MNNFNGSCIKSKTQIFNVAIPAGDKTILYIIKLLNQIVNLIIYNRQTRVLVQLLLKTDIFKYSDVTSVQRENYFNNIMPTRLQFIFIKKN